MHQQKITRAALLLALTLVFQSLRMIFPLPPVFTTFIIGSLVNACVLLAVEKVNISSGLVIAVAAPIAAYLQNLLPIPVLVLPVALGNGIYAAIFYLLSRKNRWAAVAAAAFCKTGLLFFAFSFLLGYLSLNPKVAAALLTAMGWPQLVTGVLGGIIAASVAKRIQ